jgi:hypothetical protein
MDPVIRTAAHIHRSPDHDLVGDAATAGRVGAGFTLCPIQSVVLAVMGAGRLT